ncbi:MAG: ABC transporter permease [Anaerolineales bacterium]|jgi:ABC-2 type transport system permease protein
MKILDIALKDMTRSFRSYFALMFMFGVPLMMGGMFYFMFGSSGNPGNSFSVPATKVVVANLDNGGPGFDAVKAQFPVGGARSMGGVILATLQDKRFADLMVITTVDSVDAARSAVDQQAAGVAIIIPADFSERFSDLAATATIELYKDPTLSLGPAIVESILSQYMDGMSGAKIAVNVVMKQTGSSDPKVIGTVLQAYLGGSPAGDPSASLLDVHSPASVKAPSNPVAAIVGLIMAGMTVFYAFFTGASSAQSILREEEEGTLPRLFTTPTSQTAVLGGKLLAVVLTVAVQMTVMVILGRLIFAIPWGNTLPLALVILGSVIAASAFGVFLMSLLKNAKQAAVVFGGVVTATGMLGMAKVFTGGSTASGPLDTVSLFVPQGWAVRGLLQTMNAAPLGDISLTVAGLLVISAVLFTIGAMRFQKRYA